MATGMSRIEDARRRGRLELTGARARAFIWLYFVTVAAVAIWSLDSVRSPWPTVVAIVIFGLTCLVLSLDTGDRLSLRSALFACASGLVMTLLVSWQVVEYEHTQWQYAQWYFGAAVVAQFYLCLRGRAGWAWIGYAAMSAVVAVWAITTDSSSAVALIARQLPVIVTGTVFAISMRRTVDQIESLAADTSARMAAKAATEATAAERRARLAELETIATPLLRRLVEDRPPTDDERVEFALAEAELRDSVRGRSFRTPTVSDAARDARRRGVGVILLDDSGAAVPQTDLARVHDALVRALESAMDGTVTARLMPAGREQIATIVVDGTAYAKHEVTYLG
jgi:hypothetical protein